MTPINAFIVADALGGYVMPGKGAKPEGLCLEIVRLPRPDLLDYRGNCLYVVETAELEACAEQAPRASFAIASDEPPAVWEHVGSLVVLPGTDNTAAVFNRVFAVFERFRELEADMMREAIAGGTANDAVRHCSKLLTNPIAVSDATFTLVARTDAPGESDLAWEAVEAQNYGTGAPASSGRFLSAQGASAPRLFSVGSIDILQTCICTDGKPAGYIGATAVHGPFTAGQTALIWWITKVLESMWPQLTKNGAHADSLEQAIVLTIEGAAPRRSMIARTLEQHGWPAEGRYRMLCFHHGYASIDKMQLGPATRLLRRALPSGVVFSHAGDILAVLEGAPAAAEPAENEELRKVMADMRLFCSASPVHSCFDDLRLAYGQCAIARDHGPHDDVSVGSITTFTDVLIPYLLERVGSGQDLDVICHPQIAALARRGKGTEFLHSLRVYLAHGCSMSRAARALYVHRSTLSYRIEQIEGELGFSLSQADESELVHLYLSCLILEGRTDGAG